MKRFLALILCVLFIGCTGAIDQLLGVIEECGMSFDDLVQQNDVSEDCRNAVESLLPEVQNNFTGRLIVLGTELDETTNQRIIYLSGVDASGNALTSEALQAASITVTEGGTDTVLTAADFSTTALSDLTGDIISLSVVTDYSGSMMDEDLDTAAEIDTDIISILPEVCGMEVIYFSETVTQKLDFTETRSDALASILRDDSVERSSTALYDGMGAALAHLIASGRPIRFLITSTDGLENASTSYTKASLIDTIKNNRTFFLMLGSLFSDVDELTELAGENGVFFYAPSYAALKDEVVGFVNSLGETTQVAIDAAYQAADSAAITVGDLSTTVEF